MGRRWLKNKGFLVVVGWLGAPTLAHDCNPGRFDDRSHSSLDYNSPVAYEELREKRAA